MKWTLIAVLCLSAFACKSQEAKQADPLPFHVALLPVDVEKADLLLIDEDDLVEVKLDIDSQEFSQAMVQALDGKVFSQATLLSVPGEGVDAQSAWLAEARAAHADLILAANLTFDEDIGTELNDRFWMNLPLFLLGGPATWFVNDRTYQFDVRVTAYVYDVTAATREGDLLDKDSQITRFDQEIKEASLDFLDRADGAGSYVLSIIVPSGYLAKESDKVPEELELSITEQLGVQVAQAIQTRAPELEEAENLVDFRPVEVRWVEENGDRFLEGSFSLTTGQASNLNSLAYRVNGGELIVVNWSEVVPDEEGKELTYSFRVPAGDVTEASVQIEVGQDDRDANARTYTYSTLPETR